jgi:DNA polymerase-3 subunit epsilon
MVLGRRIDPEAVAAFVADARIIIAHNANFDRRFAEAIEAFLLSRRAVL